LENHSINYVFTDPPFGDYIPYSEINQINEAWLGKMTVQDEEIIISKAQGKEVDDYQRMMELVFKELSRVLKDQSKITLVFHSAKASVWKAMVHAYLNAGLSVETSSILNKIQGSFKQVTSSVVVKGDPLLLLSKANYTDSKSNQIKKSGVEIINGLFNKILEVDKNSEERKPERLYSRYITKCLEEGIPVSMDADVFFKYMSNLMETA